MPAPKKLTRELIEERLPFCFGLLQRIADDLDVTRTAVAKFLNLPENADLKELVKSEKKRLREYAEMTVARQLISGDIETAKWFLTAFPSNGLMKKPKPYRPKKSKGPLISFVLEKDSIPTIRNVAFPLLDYVDATHPGATTEFLPLGYKENVEEEIKFRNAPKEKKKEWEKWG